MQVKGKKKYLNQKMCVCLCERECARACLEIHELFQAMISVFMTELHTLKIGLININAKKLSTIVVPTVIKFSVRE